MSKISSKNINRVSVPQSPVVLAILDGWGYREEIPDNAIQTASDANVRGVPTVVVYRKGEEVARKVGGLPEQQMREFLSNNF